MMPLSRRRMASQAFVTADLPGEEEVRCLP